MNVYVHRAQPRPALIFAANSANRPAVPTPMPMVTPTSPGLTTHTTCAAVRTRARAAEAHRHAAALRTETGPSIDASVDMRLLLRPDVHAHRRANAMEKRAATLHARPSGA